MTTTRSCPASCSSTSRPEAEAALERINGAAFDVLVTDIILPGMKGLELAERAHRLRPEMSIVVTTGFIDNFSYMAGRKLLPW